MKIVGGIAFVIGVLMLLGGLLAKSGTYDMACVGVGLMAGGILFGYLFGRNKATA